MPSSLSDYRFIVRFVVGNHDAEKLPDEQVIATEMNQVNEALSHGGKIIAMEKNFYLLNIGEHQVVSQYIVYHVAFERKPYWLKRN